MSSVLPAQPTPLVDRADELASICERFAGGDTRLLTLTGPAGVGKTRVAVAAATQLADHPGRFPVGVVFVDLTPLRDPALVLNSLAGALGLQDSGSESLLERLQDALRDRQLLLVLDNFEQVLPASTDLAALLSTCPHLTMLVTSRVPLQLRWERTLRILPLRVPDLSAPLPSLDEVLAIPSVALFLQRAQARQADFVVTEQQAPVLARLAAHLDGLPLALELAAARTATLSLPVIVHRLGERLQFLRWEAPDAPARHHSLEAAVGWSYDLLGDPERQLFRCLGVFAGRVSLNAILAVYGMVHSAGEGGDGDAEWTLERLISLAEQSLIIPERPPERAWQQEWSATADASGPMNNEGDEVEPAFDMLETVRAYAAERLGAAGELEVAHRAHAAYFLALAERADPQLRGHDQRRWLLRLERERHNLRAALRWLLDQEAPTDRAAGLRLAGALGYFWQLRGYHAEGRRWLEEALAHAPREDDDSDEQDGGDRQNADQTARMQALLPAGLLLALCGEFERAQARSKEALALARQLQDPAGVMRALICLGLCPAGDGESGAAAIPLLREGLGRARTLGDSYYAGVALFYLGMALQALGNAPDAASHYMEALELFDAAESLHIAAGAHFGLSTILGQQGDLPNAVRRLQAGLAASVTLQDRWLLSQGAEAALCVLGDRADPAGCARLLGAAEALMQATGSGRVVWERETVDQTWPELRERLTHGEREADYRQGRSLPAGEVAALAARMLDELAQTLSSTVPAAGMETMRHTGHPGRPSGAERTGDTRGEDLLAEREREVLRLVAQGLSSKAIGRQLFISERTVGQHLSSIFNKLGVNTRAQAVAVTTRRGLI
jgi:non-specific serine/threonine protein kinase